MGLGSDLGGTLGAAAGAHLGHGWGLKKGVECLERRVKHAKPSYMVENMFSQLEWHQLKPRKRPFPINTRKSSITLL